MRGYGGWYDRYRTRGCKSQENQAFDCPEKKSASVIASTDITRLGLAASWLCASNDIYITLKKDEKLDDERDLITEERSVIYQDRNFFLS